MRPSLRLARHRGTTAHVASIHPFSVQAPFGHEGPFISVDLLVGGTEFCWDPFDAYNAGRVTNPNCWELGEPGHGKSALVRCLVWCIAVFCGTGPDSCWLAIADPRVSTRSWPRCSDSSSG